MTWRLARAQLVSIHEDVTRTNLTKLYGAKYKHDPSLEPPYSDAPSTPLLFALSMGPAETNTENYVRGLERTIVDVRSSVWVPAGKGSPQQLDEMVGTVYEELRGPLLLQENWNQPTSTIVQVTGPGRGFNIAFTPEDMVNAAGNRVGVWCHLDLSLEHTEVPS